MKYLLFILLPISLNAQKLVENKKDEFNGFHIQRTDWNNLVQKMSGHYSYIRITRVDSTYFLNFKLMFGQSTVFSIAKDAQLIIKLLDGTLVELTATEYVISSKGGGAVGISGSAWYGTQTSYIIDPTDVERLKKIPVEKYRIYTTDGYVEAEVKEKKSDLVIELLRLIH